MLNKNIHIERQITHQSPPGRTLPLKSPPDSLRGKPVRKVAALTRNFSFRQY